MRLAYTLLLYLALPAVLLRLIWRTRDQPIAERQRWRERLAVGQLPPRADLWIHAVSVGEVQAAVPLIEHWLAEQRRLLVTTTTLTGAQRVQALYGQRVAHHYLPLDIPWALRRLLDACRPRLVVVMETEIWPNLLAVCVSKKIPVALVNARLSARSAQGYARLRGFTAATLKHFSLIAAQTQADAWHFVALGAPQKRIVICGHLKFDQPLPQSLSAEAARLRTHWGRVRPIWVAASTHDGEEAIVLAAHQLVRSKFPSALLVLVPRHPQRFAAVAALVRDAGFELAQHSVAQPCRAETAVYLGDTMGELMAFFAAADIAFVGGSLVPIGGHNLLEPAALGVPVLIGPQMFNFQAVTEAMLAAKAAEQVTDAATLAQAVVAWLQDPAKRARIGANGQRMVSAHRGVTQRLLAELAPLMAE